MKTINKRDNLLLEINKTLKELDRQFIRLCIQPHYGDIKYLFMEILLESAQKGCKFMKIKAPLPCYYISLKENCHIAYEVLDRLLDQLTFLLVILKETK